MEALGRLHPLVIHLPIGILFLAFAFEALIRLRKGLTFLQKALPWAFGLATVSAFASCFVGDLLAEEGGYPIELLDKHELAGWTTAYLCLAITAIAILRLRYIKGMLTIAYYVVLVSFMPALWFTGHYGGSLTHGEGFLQDLVPFGNAQGAFVSKEVSRPTLRSLDKADVYTEVIYLILNQKCESCHNPSKAKGGFMVHTPESLLQGGVNGVALVPGSATQSLMYHRACLPLDHKQHMPPKGTDQLTLSEMQLLEWWINAGAAFKGTFAQIDLNDDTRAKLKKLLEIDDSKPSIFDTLQTDPAPPSVLATLRSLGLKVVPIKENSNFLAIYSNGVGKSFGDEDMKWIEKLSKQVVWLDLKRTSISDKSMPVLQKLEYLQELNIQHTGLSAGAVKSLQKRIPRVLSFWYQELTRQ